jgi:hypothetical protein
MVSQGLSYIHQHHVALIALFVALGGTSYAAATGSIDSREIKNNSVRSGDVRNNSLTSSDVKNSSLQAKDFKAGQLPQGPRGAPGATNVVTRSSTATVPASTSGTTNHFTPCAAGERATGGGYRWVLGPVSGDRVDMLYPTNANGAPSANGQTPAGWGAQYTFGNLIVAHGFTIDVVCAKP